MTWNTELEKGSPAYKFAVADSKNIRVVAGPGTGKSFGLQRRVARLLEEGVDPKRILTVTFTRTAAQDLRKEIEKVGVAGAKRVVAKTLHSFCFQILGNHDLVEKTGRFPRPMLEYEQKPMLYDLEGDFGKLADKEKRLAAFEAAWARLQSENPGFPQKEIDRIFGRKINSWLLQHKAMLFGEMIIEAYHYLRDNPQCNELKMFDHILVDEYQDLNKAEQAVIDILSTDSNLAIIGDDDQSIYSFKYAHPDGIREFPDMHTKCESIDFDVCRRCPTQVVAMASRLIDNNIDRTLGELKPYVSNQNGNVKIIQWPKLDKEISGISKLIASKIATGSIAPEDVLILTPVREIGYRVRDALCRKGVNAKTYFSTNALRTEQLKHNFSILNLTANPEDMVALRYLLGEGGTNYRCRSYKKVLEYSAKQHCSITDTMTLLSKGKIKIPYTEALITKFNEIQAEIMALIKSLEKSRDSIVDILAPDVPDNLDFRTILQWALDDIPEPDTLSLREWIQRIYQFSLEKISYPEDITAKDHVRIMTLYLSKGLSAKFVVVMSCIDELMPRVNDNSNIPLDEQIEEQRRLFYVAITRCKGSHKDYPGTLIISSFAELPGDVALRFGIKASPYHSKETSASRFVREFEDTAPITLIPRYRS